MVGLTLDENGIPPTADGRLAVARRIVAAAEEYGIPRQDIYIDCLTLTASAQQDAAAETLEALSACKRELGVRTVLGVSNISFGLPCRGYLNAAFLTMAMQAGLDLAILNPNTPDMMGAVRAFRVLTCRDEKKRRLHPRLRRRADPDHPDVENRRVRAGKHGRAGENALADAVRRAPESRGPRRRRGSPGPYRAAGPGQPGADPRAGPGGRRL